MGTRLNIDEGLLATAEQVASRRGQSLSDFVEDALRDAFARIPDPQAGPRKIVRVELPTFRGQGLRPGVNLDDSAGLLDLMESPHAPD
jgi:hypothetical protein